MEEDKAKEAQGAAETESTGGYVYGAHSSAHPSSEPATSQQDSSAIEPKSDAEVNAESASDSVSSTNAASASHPVSPTATAAAAPASDSVSLSSTAPSSNSISPASSSWPVGPAGAPQSVSPTDIVVQDKFAIDEVLSFGWQSMLKYFWPLTGVLTTNFIIVSVPTIATMALHYLTDSPVAGLISFVISLLGAVLNMIVALGIVNLWLKVVDGEKIAIRDVYSKINRTWNYFLASLMYISMLIAGYVCLIIPGVYLQIRFQFYSYFIVESDASPVASLKASYAITKGAVPELFFLSIINYFIGWIGFMALFVGVFPAQMIQNIAIAKAYRELRGKTPHAELPPGIAPLALITNTEPIPS